MPLSITSGSDKMMFTNPHIQASGPFLSHRAAASLLPARDGLKLAMACTSAELQRAATRDATDFHHVEHDVVRSSPLMA